MAEASNHQDQWLHQIQLEHNQLRGALSMLESRLGSPGAHDSAWMQAVAVALDALIELLGVHFAREEAALPPEHASRVFPKLASSIARLNAQHGELIARFREVRRGMSADQASLDVAAIRQQIADTVSAMRSHEREETELYSDVELGEKSFKA